MQIDSVLITLGSETQNINLVKDIVIGRLLKDGVITEDQSKIYTEKWNVIMVKKSWFKRWSDKFFKGDEKGYVYKYVKFED